MKVVIKPITDKDAEQVVVECVEESREVKDIASYAMSRGTVLSGSDDGKIYSFDLSSVYYFEAVDERVFAYTNKRVLEMKTRLYELEAAFRDKFFIRCSKSAIVNLMKLDSISPSLNGRFVAHMKNGEMIVISRQYAKLLKKAVMEGASNGI